MRPVASSYPFWNPFDRTTAPPDAETPILRAGNLRAAELKSDPSRRILPWPYVALLALELAVLTSLVVRNGGTRALPYAYELGWAGAISMIGMQVYSLRRHVRALSGLGPIRVWLEFHIFAGLQGLLLVVYHSLDRLHVDSVAGFALAATIIVAASGIFGRYMFSMLPRAARGVHLEIGEIRAELTRLDKESGVDPAVVLELAGAGADDLDPTALGIAGLIAADWRLRRQQWRLYRALRGRPELVPYGPLLHRRLVLTRRAATLEAAQRVFSGWMLLHRPLAFALFGALVLHVLAHFAFRPFVS
jgi:hypothetical protein